MVADKPIERPKGVPRRRAKAASPEAQSCTAESAHPQTATVSRISAGAPHLIIRQKDGTSKSLATRVALILFDEFKKALNNTLDTFTMIPSPVMAACAVVTTSRDLYSGKTTFGELLFNAGLTLGVVKAVQFVGRGIKVVYNSGKSLFVGLRAKSSECVPFVEAAYARSWSTATVANDLTLEHSMVYELAWATWKKNSKGPFNVFGHGNARSITLTAQDIHPRALSQENLRLLRETGAVDLDAVRLARVIRTAPDYVKGKHINLFSCETGQGLAQELSNRMRVPVSAFTDFVTVNDDGAFWVMSNSGRWKAFYPKNGWDLKVLLAATVPAFVLVGDESAKEDRSNTFKPPKDQHVWNMELLP
jgi:hypothetical protein